LSRCDPIDFRQPSRAHHSWGGGLPIGDALLKALVAAWQTSAIHARLRIGVATVATGVPGPHAWPATPILLNREDSGREAVLHLIDALSREDVESSWSDIWQFLPSAAAFADAWPDLLEFEPTKKPEPISYKLPPEGRLSDWLAQRERIRAARRYSQLAPLWERLVSELTAALLAGELLARGRPGDLSAKLTGIDTHYWRCADFASSAPLKRHLIHIDSVKWHDIRVARAAGARQTKKPGRKKGQVSPLAAEFEARVVDFLKSTQAGLPIDTRVRAAVSDIIRYVEAEAFDELSPNTKRDAAKRAIGVHNERLRSKQNQKIRAQKPL